MTPTEKQILSSIGEAIKFWRKIEGLKQKELAERLGSVRSHISKIEKNHVGISLGKIVKIASALGVSPYTILSGMPGDKEIKALHKIYSDVPLKLTKEEMEIIFCQKVVGGVDPEKFYRHILDIARGEKF